MVMQIFSEVSPYHLLEILRQDLEICLRVGARLTYRRGLRTLMGVSTLPAVPYYLAVPFEDGPGLNMLKEGKIPTLVMLLGHGDGLKCLCGADKSLVSRRPGK